MKIAFFDCQFGAAGDMLLASLIDAGLNKEKWLEQLNNIALPKDSFVIEVKNVNRCSIASKHLYVNYKHEHEERHLSDIVQIIEKSNITANAKNIAIKIFENLARAEAKVHGVELDYVHFHEVGALDAIVDIVGFAIAYDMLSLERSYASPLPLGSGTVQTEHGLFPVPGPATLNLISQSGVPTFNSPIDYECLTPTGAAILATIVHSWGNIPAMEKIHSIGYGAGTKDSDKWPNVIRTVLGQTVTANTACSFETEAICVLEANLDDFSPQSLSYATNKLFEAGALDVCVVPAVMKKGRSGHILNIVCKPQDELVLQELVLTETSSIGIRSIQATRKVASRHWQSVNLSKGTIRVKIARDKNGQLINVQPEYEDCVAYADINKIPLKQVMTEALTKYNSGA